MKNKSGFTMVELLVSFVIMVFLLGIGFVSYQFIIEKVEVNYYKNLEEELLLAGSDFFTNHREEKPLSGYNVVQIDELVVDKYIETLKDRKGKTCDNNSDSKVYIYKTIEGYSYETCLVCNDYKTDGTYCDGIALGVINISAVKEGGGSYNPLLSFANASWSNKDVVVTFNVTTDVTKFIITNTSTGIKRTCDNIIDRKCSMKFSNTASYNVDAYYDDIEIAPSKTFNIKIDKVVPIVSYDLAEGTYDENRIVKVTVSDNQKINYVEYKLYKDGLLIYSGNPIIENDNIVSFKNNLNNDGTWKLDVKASDGAGNVVNETRSFVINTGSICKWVNISSSTPTSCTVITMPTNPVEGDKYVECFGPNYGKWRYKLGKVECANGVVASNGFTSNYDYISSNRAGAECQSSYQNMIQICSNIGSSTVGGIDCTTEQSNYYNKHTYEYQCPDIVSPEIAYDLDAGIYEENKTVTVTVTDNKKIDSVEYKLYKDEVLVSSGNPTGSSKTKISFKNDLNSAGTWKLDVVAVDEAGNTSNASRSFIIKICKFANGCNLVLILSMIV